MKNNRKKFMKTTPRKWTRRERKPTFLDMPHPPELDANLMLQKRIRYRESHGGITNITRKDLLNLIVVPSDGTHAYGLLKASRILSIKCWVLDSSASAPLGGADQVLVTWTSSLGLDITKRSTQMSIAPGYLQTSPPKDSLAGFWTLAGSDLTQTLVSITSPDGSIIDITFEVIFANNQSARVIGISPGTTGAVSYNNFSGYSVEGYLPYTPT
jgi:hypothetical protein